MKVYGVLDRNNCHIDISTSLKGTKRYATNNQYDTVSVRNDYNVTILFKKVNGNWKNAINDNY
jgi:hypothetical protein